MNDTTFRGNAKITYVPVVVNAKPPKQTNADRIRSMSDEELANQLAGEQYVGIRTFLLGFDKELLEDLDEEIKMAWPEAVKEKLNWLKQEATDVK